MKLTPQRIAEVIGQIEVCLGVFGPKRQRAPNIDRAIACLESLRHQIESAYETPIELIGLSFSVIRALQNAGIETAEQLERTGDIELLSLPEINRDRLLDIRLALEVFRAFEDE